MQARSSVLQEASFSSGSEAQWVDGRILTRSTAAIFISVARHVYRFEFPAKYKRIDSDFVTGNLWPCGWGSTSTGEVISFNGKLPEEMEISANTLALKIVPGKSDAIILSGSNRDKMNCYIEDNCLYLEEKNHKPIQKGGEIVLTVPESMDWKRSKSMRRRRMWHCRIFFGGGNGIFGRSWKH